jgi:hypothetical protein
VIPTLTITGTAENLKVSGKWVFTLVVNTYDRIDLLMAPPADITLNNTTYIQGVKNSTGMDIPTDVARLKERKMLRLILTPLANKPILIGRMLERKYVYGDGTGTTRAWKFWEFDHWDSFIIPYSVRVSVVENGVETRVLVENKIILAGSPDYGGTLSFDIPEYGIRINNLGALLSGKFPPSADMALIYVSSTENRWVKKTDLINCLQRYFELGKTPIGQVKFKLSWADVGEIREGGKSFYHHYDAGYFPYPGDWITTKMTITDGFNSLTGTPRIYIDETQGLTYQSHLYYWKFDITQTSPGFNPDEFRFKSAPGWLKPSDWTKMDNRSRFTVTFSAADPRSGSFELEFRGAADTYEEVAKQTGAAYLTPKFAADIPEWYTSAPSWLTVRNVWDEHSLYSDYCENDSGVWDIKTVNDYTAVAETPVSFASQLVTVEAPLDLFDAYIYMPPWGIPKIESISPELLELQGGPPGGTVTVRVKNLSQVSGDTFAVEWPQGLPSPIRAETDFPTVNPGETVDISIRLYASRVEEESTVEIPFQVKAWGSGKTDSGIIKVKLLPGYGPPEEYAPVWVYVEDRKTGAAIAGATVRCAGTEATTDERGRAYFPSVKAGYQTITAEKAGYYTRSEQKKIEANKTNYVTIALRPMGEEERSPLLIAAIVSAVAVGSGAAYYFYYKRKRP